MRKPPIYIISDRFGKKTSHLRRGCQGSKNREARVQSPGFANPRSGKEVDNMIVNFVVRVTIAVLTVIEVRLTVRKVR